MKLILGYLVLLLLPVTAIAEDICTTISNNSEVEAHFAQTRAKEIKIDGQRFYVDVSKKGGTCVIDAVWLESTGYPPQEYSYECNQNGCGFGSTASIVHWNDDLYILTERKDFGDFDKLHNWSKFSAKEQAQIKFRSLTQELYKIMPNNRAVSLCEKYEVSRRPVQEKMVNGNKECLLLMNSQAKSIFPSSLKDKEYFKNVTLVNAKNISYTRSRVDGYSIDLSQKLAIDLNGDGQKEIVVPVAGGSGAGCGCDIKSVTLLNENDEPLVPQDDFSNNFISFVQSLNCGEELDIVADGDRYYFEKKTSVGTRELSGIQNLNTHVCSYVNNAPLPWYPE